MGDLLSLIRIPMHSVSASLGGCGKLAKAGRLLLPRGADVNFLPEVLEKRIGQSLRLSRAFELPRPTASSHRNSICVALDASSSETHDNEKDLPLEIGRRMSLG